MWVYLATCWNMKIFEQEVHCKLLNLILCWWISWQDSCLDVIFSFLYFCHECFNLSWHYLDTWRDDILNQLQNLNVFGKSFIFFRLWVSSTPTHPFTKHVVYNQPCIVCNISFQSVHNKFMSKKMKKVDFSINESHNQMPA